MARHRLSKRSIKPIFDLSLPKYRGEGIFIRFLQTNSCFHYLANLFVPYLANSTANSCHQFNPPWHRLAANSSGQQLEVLTPASILSPQLVLTNHLQK